MARTTGARGISETERRIIEISRADGMAVPEIAASLGRSPKTLYKILAKMRAEDAAQACLPLGADHGKE